MEAILSDPELRVRLRPPALGNRKQREAAFRVCDVIGVISESLEDPCSGPLDY